MRSSPPEKFQQHRRLVCLEGRNPRVNEPTPHLVGTAKCIHVGAAIDDSDDPGKGIAHYTHMIRSRDFDYGLRLRHR
jgi:hypothetical protein